MKIETIDLPDVSFQGEDPEAWRNLDEEDPDDEELDETPEDVVMMLGFDPKNMDEDDVSSEQDTPAAQA